MTRQNVIVGVLGGLAIAAASPTITGAQTEQARLDARTTSTAHSTCTSYGLSPGTPGYHQCVMNEVGRQAGDRIGQTSRAKPRPARPAYQSQQYGTDGTVQTYRVHPRPDDPLYYEEYVVPRRTSSQYQ